jgi:hypothetical protein
MVRLLRFAILMACIFSAGKAFGACHAVTPSGSGSQTGADWNNSFAGLPGTLVRGDIYYLADGTYPSLTFSQSGTTTVEIRKAQSYDYGATGCTTSIAAGWNTSTMGSAQAVFATHRQWALDSPGLIINGNGQQTTAGCGGNVGTNPQASPATPTDCGIKVDNSTCTSTGAGACTDPISDNAVLSGGFTLKYVEILGMGNATSESYIIRADSSTGTVLSHIYLHYYGAVCVVAGGTSSITANLSYFWRAQPVAGSSPNHGQCFEIGGSSTNGTVSNNVFRDMSGTAAMATFLSTGTSSGWEFYNNQVWNTVGFTPLYPTTDGIVACINSHTCNSLTVMQNTTVGMGNNVNVENEVGGTVTVQNNIWYSNDANPSFGPSGTYTQDHNSFLSSGTTCPSGTSNVCDNSSSNPFVSWTTGNFNLASDNADWNNRISLSSPYTVAAAGNTFTTDRGAYQYNGAAASLPGKPTNLGGAVVAVQ